MWKIYGLAVYLVILSICDVRSLKVPVWLLIAGGGFAMGSAAFDICVGGGSWPACMVSLIPGSILLAAAGASGKVGYGDGVALSVIGLTAGTRICVSVFMISLFLTAVVSAVLLAMRRVKRSTQVPYVPFMTAALFFTLFLGENS